MPEVGIHLLEELLRSVWNSGDGPVMIVAALTVFVIAVLAMYLLRDRPQQER